MAGRGAGGDQLKALGQALKDAGEKDLRKEFLAAIQRGTKDAKAAVKESARDTLPRAGGLNEWAASLTVSTQTRLTGRNPSIVIKGGKNSKTVRQKITSIGPLRQGQSRSRKVRKTGTFGKAADMRALNRGRVMHPAWGRPSRITGKLFGPQMVSAGFFDKPLKGKVAKRARKEIDVALKNVRRELNRRTRGTP